MATFGAPARWRGLDVFSSAFGLLGLAFCWWTPTGMALSFAGLVIGLVACATARRGGRGLAVTGMILSAAALAVCWFVAAYGMELVRFSPLH